MSEFPALWIALAALISLGLVWIQYYFRRKKLPNRWLLATLRFLSLFGLLLLLINPKIQGRDTYIKKQRLVLLLDNSRSIALKEAGETSSEIRDALLNDPDVLERFQIQAYAFGLAPGRLDSLDFSDSGTDLFRALDEAGKASLEEESTFILVTDGNENIGRSMASAGNLPYSVYPIVVGDTTQFMDLRLDGLNLNRFAFLGNKYPLEVLFSYNGDTPNTSELRITDNGRTVYREPIRLQAGGDSRRMEIFLEATDIGVHRIEAALEPVSGERNQANNRKISGLEVVDERTDIRIVSSKSHPDLGALQRSILQNEQRVCRIETPQEALDDLETADLLILYQPDNSFRELYRALQNRMIARFTITGPLTDWNFLNSVQTQFELTDQGPPESLLPEANPAFSYFDVSTWEVGRYPPLDGDLGSYGIIQEHQVLLEQRVKGVSLGEPLLALLKGERREAVLFGSGIWQWRMSTFRNTGEFQEFDQALSKIVLFLTAGERGSRLTLESEPVYDGVQNASVRARFVDESFVFDPDARLSISLQNSSGQNQPTRPMSLRNGYFETFIGDLPPDTYDFTVTVEGTEIQQSGQFILQAFDLEAQQVTSNIDGLSALATATGGTLYYPDTFRGLKDSLLQADRFRPIQKSRLNVVSLIDYRWLLALIAISLSAEWFLRKYNGLI